MSTKDPDRVALVLADALAFGDDAAAKKWDINVRTVKRYRAEAKVNPALALVVAERRAERIETLAELRVSYMQDALKAMRDKLEDATLYEVAGSLKIVGELHQVAAALAEEDDNDRPFGASSKAAQDAGESSRESAAH